MSFHARRYLYCTIVIEITCGRFQEEERFSRNGVVQFLCVICKVATDSVFEMGERERWVRMMADMVNLMMYWYLRNDFATSRTESWGHCRCERKSRIASRRRTSGKVILEPQPHHHIIIISVISSTLDLPIFYFAQSSIQSSRHFKQRVIQAPAEPLFNFEW